MTSAPQERRDEPLRSADAGRGHAAAVPPGALSALLEELARAPSSPAGEDVRLLPLSGSVIGRFRLVRELGRGGFGVVYEARDNELLRSVAFKLVRPGRLRMDQDQVRREAEVIAGLSHPNLVTLFDLGHSEHGPYLVLELLQGQTLQARLDLGPVPPEEVVRIAVEVAKGLAHAHARSVVHRDLKPSNVFLCDDGRVKLLDFGLSHVFGWRSREGGTPAYMAPEQRRGAPEDERSDVYALGVLLFRALSGELPFRVDGGGGAKLAGGRAPRLDVPQGPALSELVARMLEPDPTRRPRDGAEMLAALSAIQTEIGRGAPLGAVRRQRRGRGSLAGLAALGAMLGVVAFGAARHCPDRPEPTRRTRAIAVLPFEDLSGGPQGDYLGDGLAEDISNLLTRVRELRVAASASAFQFKGRKHDAREVAEKLRADVLLLGGVRRDGVRLRVGVELVDPRTGYRLWSQVYDRQAAEVFAVQDDIARRVVSALEVVLPRASTGDLGRIPRVEVAAYDAYLRGREQLRRPVTRESLEAAAGLFEEAIGKDPGFGQAHAGLCEAWLGRYEKERASDLFARAVGACQAALGRDPGAPEVHSALGNLHLAAGKADEAEREFRKALESSWPRADAWIGLANVHRARRDFPSAEAAFAQAEGIDPTDWRVWQQHGHFLFALGRYPEAASRYREVLRITPENASALNNVGAALYLAGDLEAATPAYRRSLELAPTSSAYSNLGTALFYAGKLEEAAATFAKATELGPEDFQQWGNLGDAHFFAPGQEQAASRAYRRAAALAEARLRVNPADAEAIAELARFHARLGHAEVALRLRREAFLRDPRSVYVNYNAALVAALVGDVAEALSSLERAVALGYPPRLLPGDPAFAALRQDRRFEALLSPRGPERATKKGGEP